MTSELQKQSFDVRIKKLFETSGTAYSTTVWDGEYGYGAGSYLYHEGDDSPVLCSKGITELHVQAFKDANREAQKVIAANKGKANTKLIDKALEQFATEHWSMDMEEDIFNYMLKEVKNGQNYLPNGGLYGLKRFTQEVHLRLCPETQFAQYSHFQYRALFT